MATKFDPTKWTQISVENSSGGEREEYAVTGYVVVRATDPVTVMVQNPDLTTQWVPFGSGTVHEFEVTEPTQIYLVSYRPNQTAYDQTQAVVSRVEQTSFPSSPDDPAFTNIDRMVDESGHMQEVLKAERLRLLLEQERLAAAMTFVDPVPDPDAETPPETPAD